MKKLFSIFCVVLLSLAVNAVKQKPLALSDLTVQGNVTWTPETGAISSAEDTWSGIGINYGDIPLDVTGYTTIQLDLAEPTNSTDVYFEVNFSDNTSSNVTIAKGSKTGFVTLQDNIKRIDIKLKEANASATLESLTLCGLYGRTKRIDIVTEEHSIPGDYVWAQKLDFDKTEIENAHAGDLLEVSYESLQEGAQFEIHTNHNNYQVITPQAFIVGTTTSHLFVLTKDDLNTIKGQNSLYVSGKYVKIKGIQLIKHYDVLWSDTQVVGNWSGYIEIQSSQLSNINVKDTIAIKVSAIGTTDGPHISLYCGWENEDALKDGAYNFQGTDVAPMIVKFPITADFKNQLGNKNLLVRGVNYTMTDIYYIQYDTTTGIDSTNANTNAGVKILRDGVMYIQRGETLYNMQGQIVK